MGPTIFSPLVIEKMLFLWISILLPLCVVGAFLSRDNGLNAAPCQVNPIPRLIPNEVPWKGRPLYLVPFAGLVPFGSMHRQLNLVLASLWMYKFYPSDGLLFLGGTILLVVATVATATVITVYLCLNFGRNHKWQWTAFLSGASVGLYVLLHSVYYFISKTEMCGFLQTSFYFSEMFLIALVVGLSCGVLGYWAASIFVLRIFQRLVDKKDAGISQDGA